ncbi:MAG: ferrous iron transport protein A [Kiritimatiellae bacterium]|nr:ferrous iron transport protein A [Kiritimatiellia bacterium]
MQQHNVTPLSAAGIGRVYRVVRLAGGRGLERRLNAMGLIPGATLTTVAAQTHGPVLVEVKGSRLAIGRGMAARILVAPA